MDSFLKALLLGIVEGVTEFLPISSTGHLIITADLLNYTGEKAKTFEVLIQLGAILAVCWLYRARLLYVARGLTREPEARRFAFNIGIAFLPAAALGFLLHTYIKAYLFAPVIVACALIGGGLAILAIERLAGRPRVEAVDAIGWKLALQIGIAQAAALVPGVSRSGATIMGGIAFGLSRRAATEFSFFLAIPTMFAAFFYDLYQHRFLLGVADLGVFATGFVAAFLSALVAVKFLLHYVAHHNFSLFAWYRIAFGCVVLAYYPL